MSPLKNKFKAKARGENRRREAIIVAVADVLSRGAPTKFAYEAACRHGLRSRLCLDGSSWPAADRFAGAVVEEALRRLGAVRPSWDEGQPEHVSRHGLSRFYCAWPPCGKVISEDRVSAFGRPVKFCSNECGAAAKAQKQRHAGMMSKPEWLALRAARTQRTREEGTRPCAHCGTPFFSYDPLKPYCSQACYDEARAREYRPCTVCGKPVYWTTSKPRKYCSKACQGAATRKSVERICGHCGKAFSPRRASDPNRFCSPACGYASRRRDAAGAPDNSPGKFPTEPPSSGIHNRG